MNKELYEDYVNGLSINELHHKYKVSKTRVYKEIAGTCKEMSKENNKYKHLEEEIGFSLEIAFRALKEGIYVEENIEFEKHVVRGIELNGLGVINNICPYGECDFTCYYKDYKKTWFLKADRSE